MMVDPKKQAEMDQALEQFTQTIPKMLWSLYSALILEGFTIDQAMAIILKQMEMFHHPS